MSYRTPGTRYTISLIESCLFSATRALQWYDIGMEQVALGALLKIRNRTYGWRDGIDYRLDRNEMVVLYGLGERDMVPGVPTVQVMHGKYGLLTCIVLDLSLVENNRVN